MKPHLFCLILAGASACGVTTVNTTSTAVPQPVKIGSNTTLPGALPVVAAQNGYFKDAGVEVQLETLNGPQDATVLVGNGQLDAAVVGFTAGTFNAVERGLDVKIVGSLGRAPAGYRASMMVRKDLVDTGQVRTADDLRGRRIGSFGGASSSATYQIAQAIGDGPLRISDVELVNLSFSDAFAALKGQAIDAAYLPVPFSTDAINAGIAVRVGGVLEEEAGPFTAGVVFGGTFARERPTAARGLMVALVRAARNLRGDGYRTAENLAIVNAFTKVPIVALDASGPINFTTDLRPDTDTLLDMQRVWLELGVLAHGTPLPIERLADSAFSSYAVDALGHGAP